MDNQDEQGTVRLLYAIEDEHRLHSEVPGACAIGCGHYHGKRSDHESDEGS